MCVSHLKVSRNRDYSEFEDNADTDLLNLESDREEIKENFKILILGD